MSKITLSGRNRINKRNSDYDRAKDNGYLGDESDWLNTQKNGVVSVYTVQKTYERDLRSVPTRVGQQTVYTYQELDLVIDVKDVTGQLTITHNAFKAIADIGNVYDAYFKDGNGVMHESLVLNISQDTHDTSYKFCIKHNQDKTNCETITINAVLGSFHSSESIAMVDVTETHKYFGPSAGLPSSTNFLDGDSYMFYDENDLTNPSNGRIMVYSILDEAWHYLSDPNLQLSNAVKSEISGKAHRDALSTIPAGSVHQSDYEYVNTLITDTVDADFIGSKEIKLKDDGYIYGGEVDPSAPVGQRARGDGTPDSQKPGFIIDTQGYIEAYKAILTQAKVYSQMDFSDAEIIHPCFSTVEGLNVDKPQFVISDTYGASDVDLYPTYWKGSDATMNNITANELTSISNSYYGNTTISRVCRCTSPSTDIYQHEDILTLGRVYSRTGSTNWNIPENGSYVLEARYITTAGGAIFGGGGAYININGIREWSGTGGTNTNWQHFFKTLRKGDVVTFGCTTSTGGDIDTDRIEYTVYCDSIKLSHSGITSAGLWWSDSNNNWYKIQQDGKDDFRHRSTRLYISNNWDSNSNIRYCTLGSIASSYMSGLSDGNVYSCIGSLTYNGSITLLPTFISKVGSTGTLICINTNSQKYELSLSSDSFYRVNGTLQIKKSERGIQTLAMYPDTSLGDYLYDIGDGTRHYRNIYCWDVQESSKRELKTNIEPFTDNATDIINSVDVVSYNFKGDINIPEEERIDYIGFIADDTDSRLSGKKHDSFMSKNCIGVLMKAVQELSAKVTELEAKLQDK